jgi:hypothetical protein
MTNWRGPWDAGVEARIDLLLVTVPVVGTDDLTGR